MEKTIEQWFQELPEPYKTKALTNCQEQSTFDWNTGDANCNSSSQAIAFGFLWQDTPEGEEYWQEVYDTIAADEDAFITLEADEFDDNHKEEQQYEAEQENQHLPEFED